MKLIFVAFSVFVVCSSCSPKAGENQGYAYPSEEIRYSDSRTGASIRQLTNYKGNSHHFYFTKPGWYDNDQKLLFSSAIFKLDSGWTNSMTSCSADGKYVYFSISEDLSHSFEVDVLRGYTGFNEIWEAKPHSKIIQVATDGSRPDGGAFLGHIHYENPAFPSSPTIQCKRDQVLFTTDRTVYCNVYLADLKEFESLPSFEE